MARVSFQHLICHGCLDGLETTGRVSESNRQLTAEKEIELANIVAMDYMETDPAQVRTQVEIEGEISRSVLEGLRRVICPGRRNEFGEVDYDRPCAAETLPVAGQMELF